jgi:hypothetical protein
LPKSLHSADSRAEVLRRLAALSPQSKPAWGKMNVGRMLCHLGDSMRMSLGDLETRSKGKRAFHHFPLKQLAIYVLPWPKGAPTAQELLSTQPSDFEADAARLRTLVDRFGEAKGRPEWPEHPLFGPLSEAEWGHLSYRHIDHHFGQFGV